MAVLVERVYCTYGISNKRMNKLRKNLTSPSPRPFAVLLNCIKTETKVAQPGDEVYRTKPFAEEHIAI